ncbi:hypothetical protein EJ04DRAFT_602989 [Polyplosphaeria fusca]|uniref:Uncharacterized protein n=1 Tax=Polyplosphaeria fusca TaxID=682080 RepID=A0A9P4R0C0_9PLEO|nr:hypothetical protein EJ04DRAFT_602989 [Polyplosphaeria fusca]
MDFTLQEAERFIVAIDFGTTFSSMAYIRLRGDKRPEEQGLDSIKCVGNYPGYRPPEGSPNHRKDVPTELWYDPAKNKQKTRLPSPDRPDQGADQLSEKEPTSDDDTSDDEDLILVSTQSRRIEKDATPWSGRKFAARHWGFGVQAQLNNIDIPKDNERRLLRFKLLLDRQRKETADIRTELNPVMRNLMKLKFVKKDTDIFAHYLTDLLHHAKNEWLRLGDFREGDSIEFVLCVPAQWPVKACRVMQNSLQEAVKIVGLGAQATESVCNLFMISEPEAAAACVLAEHSNDIQYGETIVILDAGGGTVDAVSYRVTNEEPLRFEAEVVPPYSLLCGASYINERFRDLLQEKLGSELYLEKNGKTIKSIVDAATISFENNEKRLIDLSEDLLVIKIDDLKEDLAKNFRQNRLELSKTEIVEDIFRKSLRGTMKVLKNQLDMAGVQERPVKKVILTGGFGQSPALQNYLRSFIGRQRNCLNENIDFLVPNSASTAVARGAVLRALNKSDGPARITHCSYGFLLNELYQPQVHPAHKGARVTIDPDDGRRFVNSAIDWVITAGTLLDNGHTHRFEVRQTFPITRKKLLCDVKLWVSEESHLSHFHKGHAQNSGAEEAGKLRADMTFLKDQGLIEPQLPLSDSTLWGTKKKYWAVHYDVVLIVEGRSLRYEAHYPPSSALQPGEQPVIQIGQVCIAAAFQPGTA